MPLQLPRQLYERMIQHLEATYPEEGAGFLLGRELLYGIRRVMMLLPGENLWPRRERERRFLLSPQAMLAAEEMAEEQGLWLLGLYHSHPDHPPRPSAFDLAHALPHLSYLIVQVEKGKAGEVRAWRLREDRTGFDEEIVSILEA